MKFWSVSYHSWSVAVLYLETGHGFNYGHDGLDGITINHCSVLLTLIFWVAIFMDDPDNGNTHAAFNAHRSKKVQSSVSYQLNRGLCCVFGVHVLSTWWRILLAASRNRIKLFWTLDTCILATWGLHYFQYLTSSVRFSVKNNLTDVNYTERPCKGDENCSAGSRSSMVSAIETLHQCNGRIHFKKKMIDYSCCKMQTITVAASDTGVLATFI